MGCQACHGECGGNREELMRPCILPYSAVHPGDVEAEELEADRDEGEERCPICVRLDSGHAVEADYECYERG